MVIELKLQFKDAYLEDPDEPLDFVHTLSAPEGFEITGGQIFVERAGAGDFERFSFRIDRDNDGKAKFTIIEGVG